MTSQTVDIWSAVS